MSHAYEAEQALIQDESVVDNNKEAVSYYGRKKRNIPIQIHASNMHGQTIVNAVTGCPFSDMTICVGDKDEDVFFRVIDATGYRGGSSKYYYTNPEAYMVHTGNYIPTEEVKHWHEKQQNRS
jgi:hypothetical protein